MEINNILKVAEFYETKGELENALELYQKALRIVTPDDYGFEIAFGVNGLKSKGICEYPADDKLDSWIRSKMVSILREFNRYSEAYRHASIAQYLDRLLYGESHNDTAASYHDMGLVELDRQNRKEALEWFNDAEKIDDRIMKNDPQETVAQFVRFRRLVRAHVTASSGKLEEAVKISQELLPYIEARFPVPFGVISALSACSEFLQNICEHYQAKPLLEKAIEIFKKNGAQKHPLLSRLYSNYALLLHELGDYKKSMKFAKKSLKLKQKDKFRMEKENKLELLVKHYYDEKTAVEQENLKKLLAKRFWGIHYMSTEKNILNLLKNDLSLFKEYQKSSTATINNVGNDIFLSFNTGDKKMVASLHDELERMGLSVFTFWEMDEDDRKLSFNDIIESISPKIKESNMVLMVASGTSITSRYVYEEVKYCISPKIPLLIWYPEGVRLQPTEASSISILSNEHLLNVLTLLCEPGVYAIYGYGMRERQLSKIALSIKNWYCRIHNSHKNCMGKGNIDEIQALVPTRMWPIFINNDEEPIFEELCKY